MEVLIKLNTQTAGRDKLARLLQYLSKLLWYRFQQARKGGVDNLKNLEFELSTFRKLLRFGRCIDSLHSALPLFQAAGIDDTTRFTLIISKIANALFLFGDHIVWLGRINACNVDTEKWSRLSNKYWLYSITMNLVRDFHELSSLLQKEKQIGNAYGSINNLISCYMQNKPLMVDTIKNCCDFFIPLNALGHVKLSAGTIGLLGVISSLAGVLALVEPKKFKLTPQ